MSGYRALRGASTEFIAQLRELDVSSGFLEVIASEDMDPFDVEALTRACEEGLRPKGITAIVHRGDVELRALAPEAVPRLEKRVRQLRDLLGEIDPDVGELAERLRELEVDIVLAGVSNVVLDVTAAPGDERDGLREAGVQPARMLGGLIDGTGFQAGLTYRDEGESWERWEAWIAGVAGVKSACPSESVRALAERLVGEAEESLGKWALYQFLGRLDPDLLKATAKAVKGAHVRED